jgi:hypothetical protein
VLYSIPAAILHPPPPTGDSAEALRSIPYHTIPAAPAAFARRRRRRRDNLGPCVCACRTPVAARPLVLPATDHFEAVLAFVRPTKSPYCTTYAEQIVLCVVGSVPQAPRQRRLATTLAICMHVRSSNVLQKARSPARTLFEQPNNSEPQRNALSVRFYSRHHIVGRPLRHHPPSCTRTYLGFFFSHQASTR